MNRRLLRNSLILVVISLLVIFLLLRLYGGRKTLPRVDHDHVVYAIRKSVKYPGLPPEVRNRASQAISKWQNGVADSEPVLINAVLSTSEGSEEVALSLTIFDEDKDVIGFGIKEQHKRGNNHVEIIEEIYPAYIHYPLYRVANVWLVEPVCIRTENQRKNEDLWQKYVGGSGEIVSLMGVKYYDFPPVWVSVPEPDKIDVWIWVYDKAGHKSEAVKLYNFINYAEENERKTVNKDSEAVEKHEK